MWIQLCNLLVVYISECLLNLLALINNTLGVCVCYYQLFPCLLRMFAKIARFVQLYVEVGHIFLNEHGSWRGAVNTSFFISQFSDGSASELRCRPEHLGLENSGGALMRTSKNIVKGSTEIKLLDNGPRTVKSVLWSASCCWNMRHIQWSLFVTTLQTAWKNKNLVRKITVNRTTR